MWILNRFNWSYKLLTFDINLLAFWAVKSFVVNIRGRVSLDGNCGFRAIAEMMGDDKEMWYNV